MFSLLPTDFLVIPGHRRAMNPEAMNTGYSDHVRAIELGSSMVRVHGFRVRAEGAPRNDDQIHETVP
jgi:hypothetical protein